MPVQRAREAASFNQRFACMLAGTRHGRRRPPTPLPRTQNAIRSRALEKTYAVPSGLQCQRSARRVRASGQPAQRIPSRQVDGVPAAPRPGESLCRATARQLQSGLGRRSPSTLMSLYPTPQWPLHECPPVRCVNPLSQPPYPFLLAAQRRSPRGTRGTEAEPRGSLPSASAGVKWAQRKPRDACESASARRGACATIAGAVPRSCVERLPVSRRSREDQLARAAQPRRLLERRNRAEPRRPEGKRGGLVRGFSRQARRGGSWGEQALRAGVRNALGLRETSGAQEWFSGARDRVHGCQQSRCAGVSKSHCAEASVTSVAAQLSRSIGMQGLDSGSPRPR